MPGPVWLVVWPTVRLQSSYCLAVFPAHAVLQLTLKNTVGMPWTTKSESTVALPKLCQLLPGRLAGVRLVWSHNVGGSSFPELPDHGLHCLPA
mmetsp:Transcript_36450/g.102956  ORF Transcript_36450/g.102956 Transcript_36450/m.102956 type:complete len:93 (+) Transcript_36450:942-1220(+)